MLIAKIKRRGYSSQFYYLAAMSRTVVILKDIVTCASSEPLVVAKINWTVKIVNWFGYGIKRGNMKNIRYSEKQ